MFPYRLKQLREDAELTQSKLADMLYLTQSTIAYYENGKKAPTLDNAIAIARVLNVSMDYLCGLTNNYQAYLAKTDPSPIEKRLKLAEGLSDDSQKLLESYIDYLLYKEEKNQTEIKYHKSTTESPLVDEGESNTIDNSADYI